MVPERKQVGNFTKDREIYGWSSVWTTDHRWEKIYGLCVGVGLNEIVD